MSHYLRLERRRVLKEVVVSPIFKYSEHQPLTNFWPVSRLSGHSSEEWEIVQGCGQRPWKASRMMSQIGRGCWTGQHRAVAATVPKRFPRVYCGKRCRLAETCREYWTVGIGPIVSNRFESFLLDIPPYRSISTMNWEQMFADRAFTTTNMVPTDNGGHIPATFRELVEVVSRDTVETLPLHWSTDHAIDLEPSYILLYGRIHNRSEFKLRMLKSYIEANLANWFILLSLLVVAAPILDAIKMDGGLRRCADNFVLNLATVKNRYPLPLISEMLARIPEARIFKKLDLRGAYNLIRIQGGDEYKMACGTCDGQFKYRVMPFSVTTAPARLQSFIHDCLWPCIDGYAVGCLEDILISSTNEKAHEDQVHQVLQRLQECGLWCKADKCQFGVLQVCFLGFVITPERLRMESDLICTTEDWLRPKVN